jgi:hypothetical protein
VDVVSSGILVRFLLAPVCLGSGFAQNTDIATLPDRIAARPFNMTVIGDVLRSGDRALLSPLRQAFDETEGKREKQVIAETLIKLGDKDSRYFEYLAGFAKRAVESVAPAVLFVRGIMNPEFEPWCRDHGLNVEQEIVNQLKVYPEDLMALVSARDARAIDILRQGLASRNPMVWILAVQGLSVLQDRASIREIIATAGRFPASSIGFLLGGALAEYDSEPVRLEILAALSDPALREVYTKALESRRKRTGADR